MPSITVICRDSSVKSMISGEIMNAFRPKQRQSMWLKCTSHVVSVCRSRTFSFNITKTQRNQKKDTYLFLSICHATCIHWINFNKESMYANIRWYANFCKVKRYQNYIPKNALSLICYSMVECIRKMTYSKNWSNLYEMFYITGSLRVLHRQ